MKKNISYELYGEFSQMGVKSHGWNYVGRFQDSLLGILVWGTHDLISIRLKILFLKFWDLKMVK